MRTHNFALQAHNATPAARAYSLDVAVEAGTNGSLRFVYSLRGDLSALEIPEPAHAQRTDDLWRRTCFEAFLRPSCQEGYLELNFSPSSEWAAYSFSGYRKGMTPAALAAAPVITCEHDAQRLTLEAHLTLAQPVNVALELALSAVLRERSGKISYWALRHAPDKPDFHHDASFAAMLDGVR